MPNVMSYKGYTARVDYVAEDRAFFGKVVDLSDTIVFSGATVDELESSFHAAVDDYLDYCEERGVEPAKPFSGRVQLRMPPSLHRDASIAATSKGESLNSFIVEAVNHAVGESTSSGRRVVMVGPVHVNYQPFVRERPEPFPFDFTEILKSQLSVSGKHYSLNVRSWQKASVLALPEAPAEEDRVDRALRLAG